MANKIEPGKYEARIVNYGIGQTKAGDPQVMVLLEYLDKDGQSHEITWYGHVKSPEAANITAKALLCCGMRGNEIGDLADGVESGVLDTETPVKITVELEPKQDGNGTYARVKWINRLGGQAFQGRLTKSDAKLKLAPLNLKGAMMMARQETGIADKPKSDNFDDIPF